jgi:hypothetical protein
MRFGSGVAAGSSLMSVSGGDVEARHLTFLHSGASKGCYFNVTQGGVVVLNESLITLDPLNGFFSSK